MAAVIIKPKWQIHKLSITPETLFRERRQILKAAGLLTIGFSAGIGSGCGPARDAPEVGAQEIPPALEKYPAPRNARFVLDRAITDEAYAASYNNYYEFSAFKGRVYRHASKLRTHPWQIEIGGLVDKPRIFDVEELIRAMPIEERLYRFRCVEAWAMAVPWTGFALKSLIQRVQPLSAARYVRFVTFFRPGEASNQNPSRGPWPYTEGLSLDEATNELSILATGMYGHPLSKQNGAPLRLVAPWKYGFKSIKGIMKIEFTAEKPRTFWNSNRPNEYDFGANVDPRVPHPRWSQAHEKLIDSGERRATLPYNGYGEWVAKLYA
jgi:methionine sulfoxide reductase catalytic subunit